MVSLCWVTTLGALKKSVGNYHVNYISCAKTAISEALENLQPYSRSNMLSADYVTICFTA
jgi:hypothetical protein